MFQHQGVWLPDGEKHFPDWMDRNGEIVEGRGTYQIKKLREALRYTRNFRLAVDVGAHVGLWAMHLAARFQLLHAYEPVSEFRQCFALNVEAANVVIHPCALGAASGKVGMAYDRADSGGTHVGGEGEISLEPLDLYGLENVDFIKIDCEGYEHHVIEGAKATLLRCRPCVIVEQKPHKLGPNFGIKGTPAVDALRALGAEVRTVMSGDYIMNWA